MQQLFSTEAFKKAEAGIPGPAVRQLRLARFPLAVSTTVPAGGSLVCGYLPPGSTIIPRLFCIDDPDNLDSAIMLDYARVINEEGSDPIYFHYGSIVFVKPDGTSVSALTTETSFPDGCEVRLLDVRGLDATIENHFLYILYL